MQCHLGPSTEPSWLQRTLKIANVIEQLKGSIILVIERKERFCRYAMRSYYTTRNIKVQFL